MINGEIAISLVEFEVIRKKIAVQNYKTVRTVSECWKEIGKKYKTQSYTNSYIQSHLKSMVDILLF